MALVDEAEYLKLLELANADMAASGMGKAPDSDGVGVQEPMSCHEHVDMQPWFGLRLALPATAWWPAS